MADNVKRIYEGMFLVDATYAAANWDEVLGWVNRILERADAEVITMRKWDERRLCYEIKGCRRGTYILAYFKAAPSVITSVERDVALSDQILRAIIIRADHLSKNADEAMAQMNAATPAETSHVENSDQASDDTADETADEAAVEEEEVVIDVLDADEKE